MPDLATLARIELHDLADEFMITGVIRYA